MDRAPSSEAVGHGPARHATTSVFGTWSERLGRDRRRVIVFDDDPTGTQTFSDIDVILQPSRDEFERFFRSGERSTFVLTNSRALAREDAVSLVERLGREVAQAAAASGQSASLLLRGDSTLRGHVFAEIDAVSTPDSIVLFVPAFPEGGRTTVDGIQYLQVGSKRIPVARSEFAQDSVFGYRSEKLVGWVAEVGGGRPATMLPLSLVRQGPAAIAAALRDSPPGRVVIPEAETRADLEMIAWGLLDAEDRGCQVVVRCASSFASVRSGSVERRVEHLEPVDRVLLVCGSYTQASTRQLQPLMNGAVVLSLDRLLDCGAETLVDELAGTIRNRLNDVGYAALITERVRPSSQVTLEAGSALMSLLAQVVASVAGECDAVIAKGGITSAKIATDGLSGTRARVRGQLEPGVALWDLHLAGGQVLPYVVVPGNVGDDGTLDRLLSRLHSSEHPR